MPEYDQSRFSLDVQDADDLELIEMFLEEIPERINMLKEAAKSGDFSSLNRLSHQLKGAAPGFGFDPIGLAAGVLERRLKESNLEMLELEQVRSEYEKLIQECESYLVYLKS